MEAAISLKPLKIGNLVAKHPVIQGGMGVGVSLSSLAGAVAKAGGIGIISTAQIGFKDQDFGKNPMAANLRAIHSELKKAREKAPQGILGFNIMVATKEYASYVKEAVKAGADVIISGAGLPIDMPKFVAEAENENGGSEKKERRTMIAPIVSSVKSALVICRMWDRKYHTAPDYPWNDNNAVLRHVDNNKWYGLIMTVDGGKLGLSPGKQVEILNVKCDPVLSSYLRQQQGFYPAYRMNKENWLSILLADSENDETIKNLIDWSYQATAQKKSVKSRKA